MAQVTAVKETSEIRHRELIEAYKWGRVVAHGFTQK